MWFGSVGNYNNNIWLKQIWMCLTIRWHVKYFLLFSRPFCVIFHVSCGRFFSFPYFAFAWRLSSHWFRWRATRESFSILLESYWPTHLIESTVTTAGQNVNAKHTNDDFSYFWRRAFSYLVCKKSGWFIIVLLNYEWMRISIDTYTKSEIINQWLCWY